MNTQEQAFVELSELHAGDVYAYCARRVGVHAADDATADVFAVAWRRIGDLDPDTGRQWLYGIARRVLQNQHRSGSRRTKLGDKVRSLASLPDPGPETQVIRRAQDAVVVRALEQLRPADREILRLAAWEELTGPEIAAALGISLNAVQQRLARAKRRFESVLTPKLAQLDMELEESGR